MIRTGVIPFATPAGGCGIIVKEGDRMTDTGELSDLVRIDRTRWVGAQRRITHWRRFRHHDALNSRCYDGPPHRPRRSGPVPVWLRRADVVMKTPEFSFHDRRGAPNPRANTAGDRAWRRSVDGLELRMG